MNAVYDLAVRAAVAFEVSRKVWAFRWPAVGGTPGKFSIRWSDYDGQLVSQDYVTDDFGNLLVAKYQPTEPDPKWRKVMLVREPRRATDDFGNLVTAGA